MYEEKCRECGAEIDERLDGDPICLACATRKVFAASRDAALDASEEERQAIRDLAHDAWCGDAWSMGAPAVAEVMLSQLRDARADEEARAEEA